MDNPIHKVRIRSYEKKYWAYTCPVCEEQSVMTHYTMRTRKRARDMFWLHYKKNHVPPGKA